MPDAPVTPADWQRFLRSYSEDFLRVDSGAELTDFTSTQLADGWLGYAPATEEEVGALEQRLDVHLPPSYRNFLLTSNGWSGVPFAIRELCTTDEAGWLAEVEADFLEAWSEFGPADVVELAERSLLVSCPREGDFWLLDPGTIGPGGEWTAYSWFSNDGIPPQPHAGFGALLLNAREEYENRCPPA
ncbi:SMI1/KNR4 family protein [Amycolatopsis sp. NPDC049252]|uniref:SMI1/KNR4 family protein n=1 Tax=Amycolatopsis sp. NPDC049252 TaxID=3363933 RepID=UPI003723D89B